MTTKNSEKVSLAAAATAIAGAAHAAENQSMEEVIARIEDKDDKVRTEAWQSAAGLGVPAIKPLAGLLSQEDVEVSRAAKRALWKIVRTVGRPGSDKAKKAAVAELLPLLAKGEPAVRHEVLWMLSEIGGDESAEPVAALLAEKEVREDARAALMRIPGKKSVAALKAGLASAPEDFKPSLAQALRQRGVKVKEYPSQKLVPTKATSVKAGA